MWTYINILFLDRTCSLTLLFLSCESEVSKIPIIVLIMWDGKTDAFEC